jgi:hypothetical protein
MTPRRLEVAVAGLIESLLEEGECLTLLSLIAGK